MKGLLFAQCEKFRGLGLAPMSTVAPTDSAEDPFSLPSVIIARPSVPTNAGVIRYSLPANIQSARPSCLKIIYSCGGGISALALKSLPVLKSAAKTGVQRITSSRERSMSTGLDYLNRDLVVDRGICLTDASNRFGVASRDSSLVRHRHHETCFRLSVFG